MAGPWSLSALTPSASSLRAMTGAIAFALTAANPSLVSGSSLFSEPQPKVSGNELVQRISAGESIEYTGMTVDGDVDLRPVLAVTQPVRCRDCRFTGAFNAADVLFERIVDFSGSTIEGPLVLQGAMFNGPFLLQSTGRNGADGLEATSSLTADGNAVVKDPATLSLATFGDIARFDGARFEELTDFTSAKFRGRASFIRAHFATDAVFDGVSFDDTTSFASGSFSGHLRFRGSALRGAATFREGQFQGPANFSTSVFQDQADFKSTVFKDEAVFEDVTFHGGATFHALTTHEKASFDGSTVDGPLDLQDASLKQGVSLFSVSVSGILDLDDVLVLAPPPTTTPTPGAAATREEAPLRLDPRFVEGLLMCRTKSPSESPSTCLPAMVSKIAGAHTSRDVLTLLESTAEAQGNLALANAARFELLSIEGGQQGPLHSFFDWLFYQTVAGYLVRPAHPLVAFIGLLLIGAVVRAARHPAGTGERGRSGNPTDQRRHGNPAARAHADLLRMQRGLTVLFAGLHRSILLAFSKRAGIAVDDPTKVRSYLGAVLRWAEFIGYKVLLSIFLLALGNSNSSIRELIDAVRG